ncbi:MAG: hypothetical protein ACI9R3_002968 [Verrucomicrobiales bacterium]|jgi:hypothetical protein
MQSSIQNILVPLDPSPFTDAATATACSITRQTLKDIFVGSVTQQLIDYGHTSLFLS